MYRLAICDDEKLFLAHNRTLASSVLGDAGVPYEISEFSGATELERALTADPSRFDVLLLDILLGADNGVALARTLRSAGYQGGILFVTSSEDYALDGYSVHPVHYLLKPLSKDALREALLRDYAERQVLPAVSVPIRGGFTLVTVHDILYLEALLRSTVLHTADRDIVSTMSLKDAQAALPQGAFVRCHKGFLVSMAQIRDMTRAGITLKSNQRIPIGRVYYDDVLSQFIEYIQRK